MTSSTKLYTGMDGALLVKRGTGTSVSWLSVAKVRGWSFTANLQTLDITSLSDVAVTSVAGLASYSGSAEILYYQRSGTATAPHNDAGIFLQTIIVPSSKEGGRVYPGHSATSTHDEYTRLKLNLVNGGGTLDRYIELDCFITSATLTVKAGDVVTAQIGFINRGVLTGVTLGAPLA